MSRSTSHITSAGPPAHVSFRRGRQNASLDAPRNAGRARRRCATCAAEQITASTRGALFQCIGCSWRSYTQPRRAWFKCIRLSRVPVINETLLRKANSSPKSKSQQKLNLHNFFAFESCASCLKQLKAPNTPFQRLQTARTTLKNKKGRDYEGPHFGLELMFLKRGSFRVPVGRPGFS